MVTRSHDLNIIFYSQLELNGDYRSHIKDPCVLMFLALR